ncbi:hypothetical protein [Streptomyces sp. enrichment culture]|uniref:hypothetical protein n=1 Tax=Streptomyces sp. enrichment culture TaxID=1795815 RepID=UPI003F56C94C
MRTRARTAVLSALWVLVIWGAVQSCGGVLDGAGRADVRCPWFNLGPDGESHPALMHPGDTCTPERGSSERRTYAEQREVQRAAGEDVVTGAWILGAGALGLAGAYAQPRVQEALTRRSRGRRTPGGTPGA